MTTREEQIDRSRAIWRAVIWQALADIAGPRPDILAQRRGDARWLEKIEANFESAERWFTRRTLRADLEAVCDLAGVRAHQVLALADRILAGHRPTLAQFW